MSHRVGLRYLQNFRTAFRHSPATFRQNAIRGARFQTTDASAASAEKPQNVFVKLWNSPVGLKTVHFWYLHSCMVLALRWIDANIALGLPL